MTTQHLANLPITALTSVGTSVARQLNELGIVRLFDLLMHMPKDYEDKSRIVPLSDVDNAMTCLIKGQVIHLDNRRGLSATLSDGTGQIELKFFHTYPALFNILKLGEMVRAFGEIKVSRYGIQMMHPECQPASTPLPQSGLVPIYPSVKGLHQNKLRQIIRIALNTVQNGLVCLGDDELVYINEQQNAQTGDLTLIQALNAIHNPDPHTDIFVQSLLLEDIKNRTHPATRRLIIEELVAHQLAFMYRRANLYRHKAPRCPKKSTLAKQLADNLPFDLTYAQTKVIKETIADMASSKPMLRLVQGDVGAGKTLVAAMCACYAIDGGWQVALMAPTEILAEQHFINFKKWLEPLGIGVGLIIGKQSTKERKNQLQQILDNEVQMVIGTHALFYESVQFAKLGLVIIDEQHRFGVEQRLRLAGKGAKGTTPHQLAMTATPIPRTLAMSLYGDMEVSVIDELPPNRTPITTVTVSRDRRDEVLERIRVNCKEGKQAYWICPLVEESSTGADIQSAELMYTDIANQLDIKVGLVHGKMKAGDKQTVMTAFKTGEIDLLVATTVVEVGVDVPNASLMVIENAERLGLSQLHQLRGRVGRGSEKSFCVLLYQMPLSETGIERLNILRASTDGFVIAQKDLQIRGAGELLGKRQTGDMGYYIADIVRDELLLEKARILANKLVANPAKKQLSEALMELWLKDSKEFVNA